MHFFYNKKIVELPSAQGLIVSEDYNAENRFVAFTETQEAFFRHNPTATPAEVLECRLNYGVINADVAGLFVLQDNPYLCKMTAQELSNTDIDLLQGIIKQRQHARGYLIRKKYLLASDTSKLAVLREYSLIFENEILKGERSIIRWYREDGTVGLVKEDVVNFTAKDAAAKLREIRQTRIDYLQYPEPQYVNATIQGYINALFARYKTQVNEYVLAGNTAFENAINNETNATYLAILNAALADGKTVKESILYQIQKGY